MEKITTTTPHTQHRWRAWAVNTQTSRQLGSHWFTVVVGTQTQQLQNTAEHRTIASSSQPLDTPDLLQQSTGEHRTTASSSHPLGIVQYPNLFDSPDPALSNALLWAHANAMHPPVASWMLACRQWESAVGTNKKQERVWAESRSKRQKLCNDHDISFTRETKSTDNIDAAIQQIR